MGLFQKIKFAEQLIDVNDNVAVKKSIYETIPEGTVGTINNIQFDLWGRGDHGYWIILTNTTGETKNWVFHRAEIRLLPLGK